MTQVETPLDNVIVPMMLPVRPVRGVQPTELQYGSTPRVMISSASFGKTRRTIRAASSEPNPNSVSYRLSGFTRRAGGRRLFRQAGSMRTRSTETGFQRFLRRTAPNWRPEADRCLIFLEGV